MECCLFLLLHYHFLFFDNIARQMLVFFRQQFVSSGQLLLFVSHGLSLSVTIIRSLLQCLTVFLKVPHSLSQLLTVFPRQMLVFFVNSL
jgi:hypothetical protein